MFKKDYRELSLVKHVIAWTVAIPVVMLLLTALPAVMIIPEDTGQRNTWIMVAVLAAIFLGPPVGLIMWLMNRGVHVFAAMFREGRESFQHGQYLARVDQAEAEQSAGYLATPQQVGTGSGLSGNYPMAQPYDPDYPLDQPNQDYPMAQPYDPDMTQELYRDERLAALDDPWNGTNPYGCCQQNYDAHGILRHGSPDCRHPLVVGDYPDDDRF